MLTSNLNIRSLKCCTLTKELVVCSPFQYWTLDQPENLKSVHKPKWKLRVVLFSRSYNARTGVLDNNVFSFFRASCWGRSHNHEQSFQRFLNGFVSSAKLGINLLNQLNIPRGQKISLTFSGIPIFMIAETISGSGWTPNPSIIWPRNIILFLESWHLSLFKVSPALWIFSRATTRCLSCSSWFLMKMKTSLIIQFLSHHMPARCN